ncbi:MAG: hypothetical protein QOI41_2339 [Myxococcales bacterium]|nr:hypothetical protein [Myxococcales bacterium]
MRTVAVLAASLAMVAAASGAARADEPDTHPLRFALALAAASPLDACGGAPALSDAVDVRLHRSAFTAADDADMTLSVEVDAAWRAHIVEKDRAGVELGRRDVPLSTGDCAKSLDTLAVVLAIIIGPPRNVANAPDATPPVAPVVVPERRAVVGQPPPTPLPPAAPPASPGPSPLASFDDARRWRASPVVEMVGGTGVLPHLSFGVQGGIMVRPPVRPLFFVARGSYWPARSTETAAAAKVDRAGAALLSCVSLLRHVPTSLSACGGLDGGLLHSTSIALTRTSETAVFFDAFVEARVGYRIPGAGDFIIEPLFAAQIAAVLRRDRFTFRDRDGRELTLLQPAPAAFQASIGVAVHFP